MDRQTSGAETPPLNHKSSVERLISNRRRQHNHSLVVWATLFTCMPISLLIAWAALGGFQPIQLPSERGGIHILDRQNREVEVILNDKEIIPVPLAKISKWVRQAVVTSEDRNFYQHKGIDLIGLMRATVANIQAHRFIQGGSTITEQLAKNVFFDQQPRSLLTKLKEMVVAIRLEQQYSKEQILEAYLNNVYYGHGTYGIERAAQRFFGKSARDLSLPEAAYLAGLVNAPSHLAADRHDALARQNTIIDNMARLKMVSPDVAKAAKSAKLPAAVKVGAAERSSYYVSYLRSFLESRFNKELLTKDGVRVYSNLDLTAQALADKYLSDGVKHAPKGINQGALVSISVKDGAVLAIVGGVGTFEHSPWNRALNPHTAGSAFKPFVYLAALRAGVLGPDTMIDDAPISVPIPGSAIYSPKNFDGRYMGPITVRKALALSRNTCAVRVAGAVGPANVVETARLAGITSKLEPTLSIALGAYAVTPLEIANAYATLARGGVWQEPQFVRKVERSDGKLLYEAPQRSVQVFEQEPVAELVDALQDVVQKGTGTHAKLYDRPVAGKTGTADGARDIWFIGFTPDIVTAVWGGNDLNQPVRGQQVTGGTIMAGIWQDYMESYYKKVRTPPGSFVKPQSPFAQEAEALHFLPEPAGIFSKLVDLIAPDRPSAQPLQSPDESAVPAAPQAAPPRQQMQEIPPVAPSRQSHRQVQAEQPPEHRAKHKKHAKKGGLKKLFKKLLDIFE